MGRLAIYLQRAPEIEARPPDFIGSRYRYQPADRNKRLDRKHAERIESRQWMRRIRRAGAQHAASHDQRQVAYPSG